MSRARAAVTPPIPKIGMRTRDAASSRTRNPSGAPNSRFGRRLIDGTEHDKIRSLIFRGTHAIDAVHRYRNQLFRRQQFSDDCSRKTRFAKVHTRRRQDHSQIGTVVDQQLRALRHDRPSQGLGQRQQISGSEVTFPQLNGTHTGAHREIKNG